MVYDSSIQCGYYGVNGGDALHHTYAVITTGAERYMLPCFGGYAEREGDTGATKVAYPAELWSPWLIGSQPQGRSLASNLYVALGLAQFTLNPAFNWTRADWDTSLQHNALAGLAHHGGMIYAIQGVCHQACNRVLRCTRDRDYTYSPVNWSPSMVASHLAFGWWGIGDEIAQVLAHELHRRAGQGYGLGELSPASADDRAFDDDLRARQIAALRAQVRTQPDRDTRAAAVERSLSAGASASPADAAASLSVSEREREGVLSRDLRFQKHKHELDRALLRGDVGRTAYAGAINSELAILVQELKDILPDPLQASMFDDRPMSTGVIDPALMTQDYEALGEQVGL